MLRINIKKIKGLTGGRKKMNKKQLIKEISEKTGETQKLTG